MFYRTTPLKQNSIHLINIFIYLFRNFDKKYAFLLLCIMQWRPEFFIGRYVSRSTDDIEISLKWDFFNGKGYFVLFLKRKFSTFQNTTRLDSNIDSIRDQGTGIRFSLVLAFGRSMLSIIYYIRRQSRRLSIRRIRKVYCHSYWVLWNSECW